MYGVVVGGVDVRRSSSGRHVMQIGRMLETRTYASLTTLGPQIPALLKFL